MSLDNLFSGLAGVILGVILSGAITWWFALNSARDALIAKLLALKTYHLFETTEEKIRERKAECFQKFRDSYPDILTATLAYQRLLCPSCKWQIDDALYYYRGGNKSDLLKTNPLFGRYSHIGVASESDFEQRIDKLLETVEGID